MHDGMTRSRARRKRKLNISSPLLQLRSPFSQAGGWLGKEKEGRCNPRNSDEVVSALSGSERLFSRRGGLIFI